MFIALFLLVGCQTAPRDVAKDGLTHIALGSCLKQDKPAPIWDAIADQKPQLFLFIGDNIYADTKDMAVMKQKYGLLAAMPGYQRLKATCPILATWDDHDYGENDAGVEYPMKVESQKLFLDFFDEPRDSPRWSRPGVYDARVIGPPGRRVQIILLDTRYFRSPLKAAPKVQLVKGEGPYRPDDRADLTMLGDAQWTWLAEQLRQPAEIRIIASSIQVVPTEHNWEYWQNFPLERRRLFKTIADAKAAGVIFISGDRHLAELSRLAVGDPDNAAGYPLYDLTSSSLNQPSGGNVGEANRHRVGDHFRLVNFGRILIDWNAPDPRVQLQILNATGAAAIRHEVRLSELKALR